MVDYSITELDISNKGLTKLPDDIDKYTNLKILNCSYNEITSLDNLPSTLVFLDCYDNQLTSLDNLPPTLKELDCIYNPLKYDFKFTLENIKNYNSSRIPSS